MKNELTQEEFDRIIDEDIPQALFHVMPTDKDENGNRIDEQILLRILHNQPELLKFRSLSWFVDNFINDMQ